MGHNASRRSSSSSLKGIALWLASPIVPRIPLGRGTAAPLSSWRSLVLAMSTALSTNDLSVSDIEDNEMASGRCRTLG